MKGLSRRRWRHPSDPGPFVAEAKLLKQRGAFAPNRPHRRPPESDHGRARRRHQEEVARLADGRFVGELEATENDGIDSRQAWR
jgi:hypothetical protein